MQSFKYLYSISFQILSRFSLIISFTETNHFSMSFSFSYWSITAAQLQLSLSSSSFGPVLSKDAVRLSVRPVLASKSRMVVVVTSRLVCFPSPTNRHVFRRQGQTGQLNFRIDASLFRFTVDDFRKCTA